MAKTFQQEVGSDCSGNNHGQEKSLESKVPFPGLRAFQDYEARIFFGRDRHRDEIINRLAESRFVPVIGPSGCGKSSLIKAGVIPALQAGRFYNAGAIWHVAEMRPQNKPVWNLAEALYKVGEDPKQELDYEKISSFSSSLCSTPNALQELLSERGLVSSEANGTVNVLLLVDQFEELFRNGGDERREIVDQFVRFLLNIHEGAIKNTYCILTMRTDYLGDCARYPSLADAINKTFYLTSNLTDLEFRQAIELPVRLRQFGGDFEEGLVSHILADMKREGSDQLPLMQHVMRRMWQAAGEQGTLTMELYERFGGIRGAIDQHARELVAELSESEKVLVPSLFQQLTARREGATYQDVRRPTLFKELVAISNFEGDSINMLANVIDRFRAQDALFLRPSHSERDPVEQPIDGETLIDIVHECLIRKWEGLNKGVVKEWESAKNLRELVNKSHSSRKFLSREDVPIFKTWYEKRKPNSTWAERYGVTDTSYRKAINYLNESVEYFEELKNKELTELKEKASQDERMRRWEAEAELAMQHSRKRWVTIVASVFGLLCSVLVIGMSIVDKKNDELYAKSNELHEQREEAVLKALISESRKADSEYLSKIYKANMVLSETVRNLLEESRGLSKGNVNESVLYSSLYVRTSEYLQKSRLEVAESLGTHLATRRVISSGNSRLPDLKQKINEIRDETSELDNLYRHKIVGLQKEVHQRLAYIPKALFIEKNNPYDRIEISNSGKLLAVAKHGHEGQGTTSSIALISGKSFPYLKISGQNPNSIKLGLQGVSEMALNGQVIALKFSPNEESLAALIYAKGSEQHQYEIAIWSLKSLQFSGKNDSKSLLPVGHLLISSEQESLDSKNIQFSNNGMSFAIATNSMKYVVCAVDKCGDSQLTKNIVLVLPNNIPEEGDVFDSLKFLGLVPVKSDSFLALYAEEWPREGMPVAFTYAFGLTPKMSAASDLPSLIVLQNTLMSQSFNANIDDISSYYCENDDSLLLVDRTKEKIYAWKLSGDGMPKCALRFAIQKRATLGQWIAETWELPTPVQWDRLKKPDQELQNKFTEIGGYPVRKLSVKTLSRDQHMMSSFDLPRWGDIKMVPLEGGAIVASGDHTLSIWRDWSDHHLAYLGQNAKLKGAILGFNDKAKQITVKFPNSNVTKNIGLAIGRRPVGSEPSGEVLVNRSEEFLPTLTASVGDTGLGFVEPKAVSQEQVENSSSISRLVLSDGQTKFVLLGADDIYRKADLYAAELEGGKFLALIPDQMDSVNGQFDRHVVELWNLQPSLPIGSGATIPTKQGKLVARISHRSRVTSLALLAGGRYLAAMTESHGAWLSAWKPEDMLEEVCGRLKTYRALMPAGSFNRDQICQYPNLAKAEPKT